MEFNEHIAPLMPATVQLANDMIAKKETGTFFMGRGTCPYCRRFAEKLYDVVQETGAKVFFINSQQGGELENLATFRRQYNIPTVPGFIHIENGEVSVRCDSSMTKEEIKTFMRI